MITCDAFPPSFKSSTLWQGQNTVCPHLSKVMSTASLHSMPGRSRVLQGQPSDGTLCTECTTCSSRPTQSSFQCNCRTNRSPFGARRLCMGAFSCTCTRIPPCAWDMAEAVPAGQLKGSRHDEVALATLLMTQLGAGVLAGAMQLGAGLSAGVGLVLPIIHMACHWRRVLKALQPTAALLKALYTATWLYLMQILKMDS